MAEQLTQEKNSNFARTCFNGINALSGIGLITIPYTFSKAGWCGLVLLLATATVSCYTGILLKECLESNQTLKTYSDIGFHAFGKRGRIIVSTFVYLDSYLIPIGFLIMEGDNLSKLFPNVHLKMGALYIGGKQLFIILTGIVILPSMWLKELKFLSFLSAGGVVASAVIIFCILWTGAAEGVGFHNKGDILHMGGIPTALSFYAFSFTAHSVLASLYSSMEDKTQFYKVLIISFSLSTFGYISIGVLGYLMYGKDVSSQVTLNLSKNRISSKIAIYTILIIPIAKFALTMSPVADSIERKLLIHYKTRLISILIRTLLLISAVMVAVLFPYFSVLMALVGAIINMGVSIVLPCICYMKIFELHQKWGSKLMIIAGLIVIGISIGILGTYSALKEMIRQLHDHNF